MKGKTGKVGPHGELQIQIEDLKVLGLHPGEEFDYRVTDTRLLIEHVKEAVAHKKAAKDPVKELTGSLELDPRLADAILEADYQPEAA